MHEYHTSVWTIAEQRCWVVKRVCLVEMSVAWRRRKSQTAMGGGGRLAVRRQRLHGSLIAKEAMSARNITLRRRRLHTKSRTLHTPSTVHVSFTWAEALSLAKGNAKDPKREEIQFAVNV